LKNILPQIRKNGFLRGKVVIRSIARPVTVVKGEVLCIFVALCPILPLLDAWSRSRKNQRGGKEEKKEKKLTITIDPISKTEENIKPLLPS